MTQILYFHGCPGAAHELALFDDIALPDWTVVDRVSPVRADFVEAHFQDLSAQVEHAAAGRPVRLIGFSLGAFVALEVARRLPELSATIDLVSAAAPLQLGDFLPQMAGRQVFGAALRAPMLFDALTTAQGLVASTMPAVLLRAIFADVRGDDLGLVRDRHFREQMKRVLRAGLGRGRAAYRREVKAYVADWSPTLDAVRHPVTLWHGTADNWAPPEMASALAARLPNVAALNWLSDGSHFSTLQSFLRREQDRPQR